MEDALVRLHEFIVGRYDREELRDLCFALRVDYDSLRGEGKRGEARELLLYLGRHWGGRTGWRS